jgi:hypothetical protein
VQVPREVRVEVPVEIEVIQYVNQIVENNIIEYVDKPVARVVYNDQVKYEKVRARGGRGAGGVLHRAHSSSSSRSCAQHSKWAHTALVVLAALSIMLLLLMFCSHTRNNLSHKDAIAQGCGEEMDEDKVHRSPNF